MSESEEEAAREEEEREALAIQQRMAETLDEGDFGLDLFKVSHRDIQNYMLIKFSVCILSILQA